MTTVTRTTNPNGTYAYDVDGEPFMTASRVLYTHACLWRSYDAITGTVSHPVTMHKTQAAANRATGSGAGWVKTRAVVITETEVTR